MSDYLGEPTDEDGPLFRAAYRRADDVDKATTPAERRGAWARLIPSALVAFGEGFLRDAMIKGAVLFSVIVVIMGASSGQLGWVIGGVTAGVIGTVLVFVAIARWSFGRQWAVLLGVVLLQIVLMTAYWQTS